MKGQGRASFVYLSHTAELPMRTRPAGVDAAERVLPAGQLRDAAGAYNQPSACEC